MPTFQFGHRLDRPPGFVADAIIDHHTVLELDRNVADVRHIRAKLMELAHVVRQPPIQRALLVLVAPKINIHRLIAEWEDATGVLRPEVAERLSLVVVSGNGAIAPVAGTLRPDEPLAVEELVRRVMKEHERESPSLPSRPYEAFYDVLRVMLVLWFRRHGPLTSTNLAAMVGCSYPTLAKALKRLEPTLRRYSDRRVELESFPRSEWSELVSLARRIREPRYYGERSLSPRPPEIMRKRLASLGRHDIGVGGVTGARHYYPGIDLHGMPRLSLTVHNPPHRESDDFIRKLDPALEPVGPDVRPQLVVHSVFRPDSLFARENTGQYYADEVECLLDLYEGRLESQAHEMLDKLIPKGTR